MNLGVPHFPQEMQNSCWHASARMLYGYRRVACIHPLPDAYTQKEGISPQQFIDLVKALALKPDRK